jgi:hypothetical protein
MPHKIFVLPQCCQDSFTYYCTPYTVLIIYFILFHTIHSTYNLLTSFHRISNWPTNMKTIQNGGCDNVCTQHVAEHGFLLVWVKWSVYPSNCCVSIVELGIWVLLLAAQVEHITLVQSCAHVRSVRLCPSHHNQSPMLILMG